MLSPGDKREFVNLMRQNKAAGWQGPPGPFVYAVLRSDAVDVVYSTMEGYEALGVPYMAHIAPGAEVVTWQTKRLMSSSSAPAHRARCTRPCWPRPARRSSCSTTGRTGSSTI